MAGHMIIMLVWFLYSILTELLQFVTIIYLLFFMIAQLLNGVASKKLQAVYKRVVVVNALSILLLTVGSILSS